MTRGWIAALAWLAGCGDDLTAPRAAAVDLADVSILYPLPATRDLLIPASAPARHGALFPERWFPTAIGPVDIGTGYADLRLIAVRLDPCSARRACNPEVRAIFQPVLVDGTGALTVADGAIHVFYGLPEAELVGLLEELLALRRAHGGDVPFGAALGPHPILAATGLDGAFAQGLRARLLDHLGEARIERFTERNHQIPARDRWDFYLFDRSGDAPVRQVIATTATDEQQVTGTPDQPGPVGGVAAIAPPLDSPVVAVVDELRPAEVTDAIRAGFARAVELQDPGRHTSESIDCVSCHLAESARQLGATTYGLTPTGAFHSARSLAYQRDRAVVTNLHMFAYVGRAVSVTQRVANESAVAADAFERLLRATR